MAAPPLTAPTSEAENMHVDDYSCDYADKLPHCTDADDHGIWSMQVQACFLAHKTPPLIMAHGWSPPYAEQL